MIYPVKSSQELTHEAHIISLETSNLIAHAEENGINITLYQKIFDEMHELELDQKSQFEQMIIAKAKIMTYTWLQKGLRKHIFRNVPINHVYSAHSINTSEEIRISEVYLQNWLTTARQYQIDVTHFYTVISNAKVLSESYELSNASEFNNEFNRSFYVRYLNFNTNKIIYEVATSIVNQVAQNLKSNPILEKKLFLIHDTEKWLLKRLPKNYAYEPPAILDQITKGFFLLAQREVAKIYSFKSAYGS